MRNEENAAMIFVIAGAAFVVFMMFKFSKALGVDLNTGSKIFFSLFIVTLITIGICYIRFIKECWPIIPPFLWACFWPALDYWGSRQLWIPSNEMVWWAEWYTKAGIFFGLGIIGYIFNRYVFDAYDRY